MICFRPETLFLNKFGPKNQGCQFSLKFGSETKSNILNSVVQFTFSVLEGKHPFWANLVQKIKIVSLSQNLIASLIRICRIQWHCSLVSFRTRNVLQSRNPSSVRYGTKTISYIAPNIWSLVPETIKNYGRLKSFKHKTRKRKPHCPCRLCKVYLQPVGFV